MTIYFLCQNYFLLSPRLHRKSRETHVTRDSSTGAQTAQYVENTVADASIVTGKLRWEFSREIRERALFPPLTPPILFLRRSLEASTNA